MDLLIRELKEEDSLQVTELEKSFGLLMDSFENGEHGYTDGYYEDDSYKEDIYYSDLENPMYVASINNHIIGFIEAYFEKDYMTTNDYTCLINSIYVIDDYRKHDIGKLLIDKVIDIAISRKCDYVIAKVFLKIFLLQCFFIV